MTSSAVALCAVVLFTTLTNGLAEGEAQTIGRVVPAIRVVIVDIGGEGAQQTLEYFRKTAKTELPKAEVVDAAALDDAGLREKLKRPFLLVTTLSANSRLWPLVAQPVAILVENGTLRWRDFRAPVNDLRVAFVGKSPFGSGYGLVYAAASNSLLTENLNGAEEFSLVISRGQHMVQTACYGEDLIVKPCAPSQHLESAHVKTEYSGIEERWARAMTETLEIARSIYTRDFGFDMPDQVVFKIRCNASLQTSLSIDTDRDTVLLHLATQSDLARPPASRYHNIFGLCHELGHAALHRLLKHRDWMSSDADQDWADYIGATVVERVFEEKGEALWPEPYDYRSEGIARVRQAVAQNPKSTIAAWYELGQIIGNKGFPRLFKLWNGATLDPSDPSLRLGEVLSAADVMRSVALQDFWKRSSPYLVVAPRPVFH